MTPLSASPFDYNDDARSFPLLSGFNVREAFFWRNGNSLRSFLEEELKVDTGLPEAIRWV